MIYAAMQVYALTGMHMRPLDTLLSA
jgi:hypothetical protein